MRQDSAYSKVTAEEFLEHEGIEYRETSGSRGAQFNIKDCPACGNENWKVYLSQDKGYGNCFVCENGGDNFNLWTFAKAHLDTNDARAIGNLFDTIAKAGGWRPKRRAQKQAPPPPISGDLKLPTSIPIPDRNVPYLKDRGVPVAVSRKFGLRHCLDGAYRYTKETGEKVSVSFSGRILIPVLDLDGKLVTFQGRDITGKSDKKYLFPSRLPGTARYLYNGHRALLAGWETVVMGEGAFDVIAIDMAIEKAGIPSTGAIGSFGKKLSMDTATGADSQLQALMRLKHHSLRRVVIMWDGENEAFKSAVEAAEKLRGYGLETAVAILPKGKDPAETTPEVVAKSIMRAVPITRTSALKLKLRRPY